MQIHWSAKFLLRTVYNFLITKARIAYKTIFLYVSWPLATPNTVLFVFYCISTSSIAPFLHLGAFVRFTSFVPRKQYACIFHRFFLPKEKNEALDCGEKEQISKATTNTQTCYMLKDLGEK